MSDSFDLGEPPQPRAQPYRVLARKYRPQTFSELIGQDAMVQTLGNAIKRDRLAHAFLLTGVRGVGKTSTARLIAKALNCIGPDGQGGPTIDPCGVCEPCVAIAEGRYIDVIEMDAASNNGIDNVREMTDAVRYAAVSARYKLYIIDEVHMLSKPAFNALLKTLEEPPPHVKFLLATTEVDKVPVTVLSRCQRFDLRRIQTNVLAEHFAKVCEAEKVLAEPEALALIARAAEGSARDGLSILDQAIAHAGIEGGGVTAEAVRGMLGLSDRTAIRTLFGLVLRGDAPGALAALRSQYDLGIDPQSVLRTLLETVHGVTLAKIGPGESGGQTGEERAALAEWAGMLSFAALHRLWQLLLKGHDEVACAALPIEAGEMALLRVIHASTLPDPAALARTLAEGGPVASAQAAARTPKTSEPVAEFPTDFAALVALLSRRGRHQMAQQLHDFVGLVRYAPPVLEIAPLRPLAADFVRELATVLKVETAAIWSVALGEGPGEGTLLEAERAVETAARDAILAAPAVRAAFDAFPDAELIGWTNRSAAQ